jgi:hypothetical protein
MVRILRALKRRYQARKRHQTEHKTDERIMARWTRNVGLFTLALVFIGIITAWIFKGQLDTMQGQLDEMQAARRPWLTVDSTIAGPLVLSPTPLIPIDFVVTNIGQSPAMEAWVNATLFPMKPNGDSVQEMHKRCLAMRKRELAGQAQNPRPPGYTLFPNHHFDKTGTLPGVEKKEWEDWLFSYGRVGSVTLNLAVCGDYRFSFAPEIHSTDSLYIIGTPKPSPHGFTLWDGTVNIALTLDLGKIEKDDLVLFQEPFGYYYAD